MTTQTPPRPARRGPQTGSRTPRERGPRRRGAARVSAWCIAHPKRTLGLWLIVMLGITFGGFSMETHQLRDSQSGSGESRQADAALERAGLTAPNVEIAAIHAATPAAADAAARRVARAWDGVPKTGPVVGLSGGRATERTADGTTVLLQTTVAGASDDAGPTALRLRARAKAAVAGTGASVSQSGVASITADADARSSSGMRLVEIVSLPATLLILLLTFGSAVAAFVPLLLAIFAVAAGLALGNATSGIVPLAEATTSVVVLLGLATTVDYSLFCVKRFREELVDHPAPAAAAHATMATVGRAVLVAGSTVVIALSAMIIAGSPVFTSMAVGSMLVVTVGVISALTVLPAVLTLLGRRIDAGRLPWARRAAQAPARPDNHGWARVAERVVRRPGPALAGVSVILLVLAAPAVHLKLASADTTTLPQDLEGVKAMHVLERAFPSGPSPAIVVVTGKPAQLAASGRTLDALGVAARDAAGGSGTVTRIASKDGGTMVLTVPARDAKALDVDAQTAAVRAAIKPFRAQLGDGAQVRVTGMSAGTADFSATMRRATPIVVGFVLLLAFALLRGSFGSTVLAVGVIGLNLLSIGATYGLLALVFQGTWAEGLLGFTSIGAVVDWLPLFAFVVLFGLSMDYTVIVLERIREARSHGERPGRATVTGLSHTAVAVTSAAAVMVVVFALFGLIDFLDIKQLGIGMALAVLIDATIVRAVGLPALVALIGSRWRVPVERPRAAAVAAEAA